MADWNWDQLDDDDDNEEEAGPSGSRVRNTALVTNIYSMLCPFVHKKFGGLVAGAIGSIFNPLALPSWQESFLDIPDKNVKGTNSLETCAHY